MLPPDDDPVENRANELAKTIEALLIQEMSDIAITALAGAFIRLLIDYEFTGEEATAVVGDVSSTTIASFRDYEIWVAALRQPNASERPH